MKNKLLNIKIVAVIREKTMQDAIDVSRKLIKNNVKAIEITCTVPEYDIVIKELKSTTKALVGVGTITKIEQAKKAISAGIDFAVSPHYDQELCDYFQKENILYIPGCVTPSEMMNAYNKGFEIVKLFPASNFGSSMVSSIKAPLPEIKIMATGGINLSNIDEWFRAGVDAVGMGSSLTKASGEEIKEVIKKYAQ